VNGIGRPRATAPGGHAADVAAIDVRSFGERVLVVAPHPDDEVIAPGGLTWEARRSGARVLTLVLTCGDGYKKAAALRTGGRTDSAALVSLGTHRHAECQDALTALGVRGEDRVFLGYPDAGLSDLWESDWDPEHGRLGRNGVTEVPYPFALRPGAPYSGASLVADLEQVLRDYRPTSVVYPHASDRHPDHRAAAAFVDYALHDLGDDTPRCAYVAHFGHYPLPWAYAPALSLRPPRELRDRSTAWESLPLSRQAQDAKLAAVMSYRSQVRLPHMNVYLRAFVRRNEVFATYEPASLLRVEADTDPPGRTGANDVVVREPAAPPMPSAVPRAASPSAVRMVLGPTTLWVGVTVRGMTARPLPVSVHLRMLGGDAARVDATLLADGTVEVERGHACSLAPAGVTGRRVRDTSWIGLPASVLDGRSAVLVSGDLVLPGDRAASTAWRPVIVR